MSFLALEVYAKPVVLFEGERKHAITKYVPLAPSAITPEMERQYYSNLAEIKPTEYPVFPLLPSVMQPGKQKTVAHDLPLVYPMFIVGCDAASKNWLLKHKAYLQEKRAIGMLVQADSMAAFASLSEVASGLQINLMDDANIYSSVEIEHYPVLIDVDGKIKQ